MYDSTFLILIPAIALALYAQFKVQSTFRRYSEVPSGTGYTGA
ncbi:MAG TPA: zinc metallopeptidase, partial [bacterium]|nr:zinc metallopeptidase [bacterium]